jgi:hypothetical protein
MLDDEFFGPPIEVFPGVLLYGFPSQPVHPVDLAFGAALQSKALPDADDREAFFVAWGAARDRAGLTR